MRKALYKLSLTIFLLTLALYGLTLATVSYVGVYLTYVAVPVAVISGLLAYLLEGEDLPAVVEKTSDQRIEEIDARLKELEG